MKAADFAVRPVLVVVAAKSALVLAFAGRYGWHRDELYYAVAGKHLQGGYVEFPAMTALLSALAHALFGWSLVGFRLFAVLAGAGTTVLAALVARELGGGRRAQVVAAVAVGLSPLLVATNGLFQPVSFDQLATMAVLLLAVRALLGRGSWLLVGLAAGIGLETKYTLAVALVLLTCGLVAWRRDALRGSFAGGVAIAVVLLVPNLVWNAQHGWPSVHWFLHPSASATDESRPMYVVNLLLVTHLLVVPVAVWGVLRLWRDRALRPLAAVVVGTVLFYFVAGGKSYYAMPVVLFAVAVGSVRVEERIAPRRLLVLAAVFAAFLVLLLPVGVPVLPLSTADSLGVLNMRSDYQDEVGWHALAAQTGRLAQGADVVIASNYGEAGALEVFGRHLPPVASAHVTFRFWRPAVTGRRAVLVGFSRDRAAAICSGYRAVGTIAMPVDNEERGRAIGRCTLNAPLAALWPRLVDSY